MIHVVIGTAGHIDHGKTSLVKRLTGIDTDRLEEEKRRGMTIELGFAPLSLPSGNIASMVDVPGHEKFIKNMVAGVTGIDFFLLVIAADEGIMPQTREHVEILRLLGVESGVVALTKADLVDEEEVRMVSDDINAFLQEENLLPAPIFPVSAVTGQGIDALLQSLDQLALKVSKKPVHPLFRLPIDRVFIMQGHGTVVTGTIAGGSINKGDKVEILPELLTAKVRSLQVHRKSEDSAVAGDRCALNLSGIDKEEIERGSVVIHPGTVKTVSIVDVVIQTIKGKGNITHNQRVHVNIGTREVLARIRVLQEEAIAEGQRGYAQLRFEEPVTAIRGDRFILRSYSPVTTIGGGTVVYHDSQNRKRFSQESIAAIKVGDQGSLRDVVAYRFSVIDDTVSMDDLWRVFYADRKELAAAVAWLLQEGSLYYLQEIDRYVSKASYLGYLSKVKTEFRKLYVRYPFRFLLAKEELKSRVFGELDQKSSQAVLQLMIQNKDLCEHNYSVKECDGVQQAKIDGNPKSIKVKQFLLDQGLSVLNIPLLSERTRMDAKELEEIIRFFQQTGTAVDLGEGFSLHQDYYKSAETKLINLLHLHGTISAAQYRDDLGAGRKSAIVLLEYFDRVGMTVREGDLRKSGSKNRVL